MINSRKDELEQAAIEFHRTHPTVWKYFVRFTEEIIDRGFSKYSVNAIFERIRWETDKADSEGGSTFKLNNNHRSFYARKFMREYPQHAGFFRLRYRPSEHWAPVNRPELTPADFPEEVVQ